MGETSDVRWAHRKPTTHTWTQSFQNTSMVKEFLFLQLAISYCYQGNGGDKGRWMGWGKWDEMKRKLGDSSPLAVYPSISPCDIVIFSPFLTTTIYLWKWALVNLLPLALLTSSPLQPTCDAPPPPPYGRVSWMCWGKVRSKSSFPVAVTRSLKQLQSSTPCVRCPASIWEGNNCGTCWEHARKLLQRAADTTSYSSSLGTSKTQHEGKHKEHLDLCS